MSPAAAPDEHTRPLTEAEAVAAATLTDSTRELQPGMRLGPYRLLRPLGQGGMGQVWLAEQQEPLQRQVALKLQRLRLAGGMSEAYFQVERQALAQLVHPYIGQIYDAGRLPDGALYFAMEYVDGLTLERYLAGRRPSLDGTVGLLIKICQGVQHAHQRGLIHRDLKPGNILVIEVGGQPIPKIIDFGIAIGIDPRSGVAQTQRRAGTRAYMAPEQSVPTAEGIDARADVHALGSILTESVCAAQGITLDGFGAERMRSLLGKVTSTDQATTPAARPPADPRASRRIPAELRAIALKAMAPDRNQRYESAAALADDLERWRQSRPVRAMEQGRWYAIRCFVRRYRIATAAGVLVFFALVAGLVTAMYGLREAQTARALAEERRDKAEKLIGYMLGEFADKLRQLGKLELLDGVSAEAMAYLGENTGPIDSGALYRARAMRTLGEVQTARGQYDAASKVFADAETVLGSTPAPDLAASEWWLERGNLAYWRGYTRYQARDLDGAENHWREYEAAAQALIPLTVDSGKGLLEASYTHNNLGTLAFERNLLADAERYFRQSIEEKTAYLALKPGDTEVLEGLSNSHSWLGRVLENISELRAAHVQYRLQEQFAAQVGQLRGDDAAARMRLAGARVWLATSAMDLGDVASAVQSLEQAVSMLKALRTLDPGQVRWREVEQTARSELAWAQWYQGASEVPPEMLAAFLRDFGREHSAELTFQRLLMRTRLRHAMMQPVGSRRTALTAVLADRAVPWSESSAAPDVRLRQHLALELLAAGFPAAGLPAEWAKEVDALHQVDLNRGHFRDLDLQARLFSLEHRYDLLQPVVTRLQAIGYQHADFLRFIQRDNKEHSR